jgi:hypothetical protein
MLVRCAQHRLAPLGELPLEFLPRDGLRTKKVSITHRDPCAGTSACVAPSRPGPGWVDTCMKLPCLSMTTARYLPRTKRTVIRAS